jgi:hypothetical protein
MTLPDTTTREVIATVPKSTDLDLHVSILHTEWSDYAELREHGPSRNLYGRGVLIPASALEEVTLALLSIGAGKTPVEPPATNPGPAVDPPGEWSRPNTTDTSDIGEYRGE